MRNLKEKGLIPHYFVILHYLKGDMVTFKHISIVILLLAGCILPLPGNSIRANTKAASNDFIVVIDATTATTTQAPSDSSPMKRAST